MTHPITDEWKKYLNSGQAYHYKINNKFQYYKFKLNPCSTSLKRIIKLGRVKPGMKILDFGAGGGHDSIPLAYLGCEVDALDCSDAVLKNLLDYKTSVEKYAGRVLNIKLIAADIVEAELEVNKYDVIFSCGVMEHFLTRQDRNRVYQILSQSLKQNGYLITSVPNGKHPLRHKQRNERLSGYVIEEIDYSKEIFEDDLANTGLLLEQVKGFNLFGYIFMLQSIANHRIIQAAIKPFYLFFRLFESWLPFSLMKKHAYWLIFVSQKLA